MTQPSQSDIERARVWLEDHKLCECAQAAIDRGWLELDPDCRANRCKDLRAAERDSRK